MSKETAELIAARNELEAARGVLEAAERRFDSAVAAVDRIEKLGSPRPARTSQNETK